MFRVDYRKVNQGQSSDALALFRPSKAYSPLFSQYSLTSISAVSPDKPLCVRVLHVCAFERVIRYQDFLHTKRHYSHFQPREFGPHTHLKASLFSHLLSKGIFWGGTGQWIPAYSCLEVTKHNWPILTNKKDRFCFKDVFISPLLTCASLIT